MRRAVVPLALALSALPAHATLLFDWDLDELARRADAVVVARVEAQHTVEVGRTLMTDTALVVERVLAGPPRDRLVVRQLGGRLGRRVVDVPGDAVLAPGRRYVLFTAAAPDGHRYLVGMALGALEHVEGAWVQTVDVPLLSSGGGIVAAPGARRLPLEAVERAVQRVGRGARR